MAAMELVVVVVVSMVAARPGRGFAREKESSSRRSSTRSKEGEKRKKERRKEKRGRDKGFERSFRRGRSIFSD